MNDSSIMHQTLASHKYVEKMHEPVKEAVKNDAYLTSLLNAHRMAAHLGSSHVTAAGGRTPDVLSEVQGPVMGT